MYSVTLNTKDNEVVFKICSVEICKRNRRAPHAGGRVELWYSTSRMTPSDFAGSSASIMTAGAVAGMNLDILKSCKLIPICTEKFFCLHVKGFKNNKTRIVTRREQSFLDVVRNPQLCFKIDALNYKKVRKKLFDAYLF